jgi:SAM-dependent methyltransferase
MLMNKVDTTLVNSPANRAIQRCVEAPTLRRLGGRIPGAHALEIGCGAGYGTKLIVDQFGAATVDAIDLDPAMVTRARRRLRRYADQVRVEHGSADDLRSALGAGDASYDAVFDLGIIHHITNWRDAVAEAARVLRPGGGRSTTSKSPQPRSPGPASGCSWTTPPRTGLPLGSSWPNSRTTDSTRRQLAHLRRQRLPDRRRPTILTSPLAAAATNPIGPDRIHYLCGVMANACQASAGADRGSGSRAGSGP